MKKINIILAALMLLVCSTMISCSKDEAEVSQQLVRLNVDLKGFSIQQQDMKSSANPCSHNGFSVGSKSDAHAKDANAGSSAAEAGVAHIAFAVFDANNQRVQNILQHNTQEGFGSISCQLKAGTYIIVALGYGGSAPDSVNIQSPTLATRASGSKVFDIFAQVDTITIGTNAVENLSMTLNRAVSAFRISSTTPQPESVKYIDIKIGDLDGNQYTSWSFNPNTSLSTQTGGYWLRSYSNSAVDTNANRLPSYDCYLLLPANPTTLDVTVEALDANSQVLYSHAFVDVPFAINRYTVASGPLFDIANNFSFTFNSTWSSDHPINW